MGRLIGESKIQTSAAMGPPINRENKKMKTEQRFYALAQDNEGGFVMLEQIITPDKSAALGAFRKADNSRNGDTKWYFYGLYYSPTLAIQTKQRDQSGQWVEIRRVEFENTAARSR